MNEDDAACAPSNSRKQPRSTRPRSPRPSMSVPNEHASEGRPPAKRARKAINCEPCRGSKLKCDRNRPCSSCVLRGTTALCYQDSQGQEINQPQVCRDDNLPALIDPVQEIAKLRNSINLLEAYISANQRDHVKSSAIGPLTLPGQQPADHEGWGKNDSPALLVNYQGGLYAGPTSAATQLMGDVRDSDDRQSGPEDVLDGFAHEYDRDLVNLLPPIDTIDQLIDYYFERCTWLYRFVHQPAFTKAWIGFKAGRCPDRIVLATVCMVMAVAVHYLPPRHILLDSLGEICEEFGLKCYDVMLSVLQRSGDSLEPRIHTLELVELLLIRYHFHTLCKTDTEEIWSVRGEIISAALAMGLHRDPGRSMMSTEVAERRRWTWWNVMLIERWQAFLLGRPLSIASHHFDTQFPSPCDPTLDDSERLYLPNIAIFRLSYILGEIMDDAVSFRPVPYDSILAHDRALSQWLESLPEEIMLDDYHLACSLASPVPAILRLGVLCVVARTAFYHIRFTLHRPYTCASGKLCRKAESVELAVGAADKLTTFVERARPEFLANQHLNVPGHISWGSFHLFSAALFFCFQLIGDPGQPRADLFRANIQKAISILQQSRAFVVADKAFKILDALSPLYSPDFPTESTEEREAKKSRVLSLVRTLAFPYHDSPKHLRPSAHSPSTVGSSNLSADSMLWTSPPGFGSKQQVLPPVLSIQNTVSSQQQLPSFPLHSHSPPSHSHSQDQNIPPLLPQSYPNLQVYSSYSQPQQQDEFTQGAYVSHRGEDMMWGASVGFGPSEWTSFLEAMQRPAPSGGPQ